MSFSSLVYAVPFYNFLHLVFSCSPATYNSFRKLPTSPLSDQVKAIIKPILMAENVEGAQYYNEVQELLTVLPHSNQSAVLNDIFDRLFIPSGILEEKRTETPQEALNLASIANPNVVVKHINSKMLNNSDAFPRIQDLIDELPTFPVPKNIDSLLRHKIKVITSERKYSSFSVTGIGSTDPCGQYFIHIHPSVYNNKEAMSALPWIISHETSHILNEDRLVLAELSIISSLATAIFSSYVMNWSFASSLVATLAAQTIADTTFHRICEASADDFAIKHCSIEQLKKGLEFLEKSKARRDQHYSYWIRVKYCRLLSLHPSYESRISKIQKAIIDKQAA